MKNKFYEEPYCNQQTMLLFNLQKMKSKFEIFKRALEEENILDFGVKNEEDNNDLDFKDIQIKIPIMSLIELNKKIPPMRSNKKALSPIIPKKL